MTTTPQLVPITPNAGHTADVSHADAAVASLMFDYFGAKSAHDIATTHAFFHPGKLQYFDATLGWEFRTNAALRAVWEQYMPGWPPAAKSYATRIAGDGSGVIIAMTDTPELFGGEIRALGIVDLEDGKIVRWVDYWDGRNFGSATAAQMRVPDDSYPHDLGVDSVRSSTDPALTTTVDSLTTALSARDATAAAALFTDDAVFEDLALRTTIHGRNAIGRYLDRALEHLPYTHGTVSHIVGGPLGGGYEWTARGKTIPRGATMLDLHNGRIAALTAVWDGSLMHDHDITAALTCALDA